MFLTTVDGRRALLEFCRNLTPQVLLMTTALISYVQWDTHGGLWRFLAFLGLAALCMLLIFSNMDAYIEAHVKHVGDSATWIDTEREKWKGTRPGLLRRFWILSRLVATHQPMAYLEFLIVVAIIYGGAIVVLKAATTAVMKSL